MKKIIFTLLIASIVFGLNAQNETDALRYSQTELSGTARNVSMGSAFGALGGDASSVHQNPAGMGVYRKSEFTFTPGFYHANTSSRYLNATSLADKYNINISNVGLISSALINQKSEEPGWRSVNWGITYNRNNNFHKNTVMSGDNTSSSLLHYYVDQANGYDPEYLDYYNEGLAYSTYLIDTISGDFEYGTLAPYAGTRQTISKNSRGSMSETQITLGGNYNNKVYIGGAIGITNIRYTEDIEFKEEDVYDTIATLNEFTLNDYFETKGTGVNFKMGVIYKAADWFRLGGSVSSQTFYYMSDEYSSTMDSDLDYANISDKSNLGYFDYNFVSPWKASASVGIVLGKFGIISADYEFVNHSESRLDATSYKFTEENRSIYDSYTAAHNIRTGAEIRLDPVAIRLGFGSYGNPYKETLENDGSRKDYSFGIGFREKGYFFDLAYVLRKYNDIYTPYPSTLENNAYTNNKTSQFMVTVGFRY